MAASLAAPDLIERNLGLGLEGDRLGHTGLLAPGWIVSPLLRQVEAIGDRQAGRAIGKRERHSHLAIILLPELSAILTRPPAPPRATPRHPAPPRATPRHPAPPRATPRHPDRVPAL